MNKVFLNGNLGKDVETRTSNDKTIAKFSLAVKRRFAKEGEQDTDWLNVTCFGKTAEFCEKWLHKGSKVIVIGRIATSTYTDKDGNKRYSTDIIADEIEFGESKREAEANGFDSTPAQKSAEKPDEEEGFMNVPDDVDDSLPFS